MVWSGRMYAYPDPTMAVLLSSDWFSFNLFHSSIVSLILATEIWLNRWRKNGGRRLLVTGKSSCPPARVHALLLFPNFLLESCMYNLFTCYWEDVCITWLLLWICIQFCSNILICVILVQINKWLTLIFDLLKLEEGLTNLYGTMNLYDRISHHTAGWSIW